MTIKTLYPSISPSLMLDFANTKALDPRVSFVRTTTATYYNGVQTAKAEENLFQQSQTFGNAYWTKNNVTITDDSTTAPDGTTTAELMYPTTTGTFRQLRRFDATGQTVSVFAKASGLNFVNIGVVATSANYTWFNLSTGAVGTTSALVSSATITDAGNGWYRCAVVFTSAQTDLRIGVADSDGNQTATNSGTDGIYLWAAQLEQRSAVTAYTPTTTQPITNYIPVLQTAASGVARFDHNPTTGESLGLLVEEQRTNLQVYSEDFANAAWTKTRTSITANTIVSPDGSLTGDKMVEDTQTGSHYVVDTYSATSGTAYTLSVFAKKGERRYLILNLNPTVNAFATFDLETGTISDNTDPDNDDVTITDHGNGWYRCTLTFTATSTGSGNVVIALSSTSSPTAFDLYTGDGYSGIYIWGAQLEAGAFPTSYIPTVAATVTRNADAASMTGTNFSSWYRADEGAIMLDYKTSNQTTAFRVASISDGTTSNRMEFAISSGGGSGPYLFVVVNGAFQVSSATGTYTANTNYKWSAAYEINNYAWSKDGAATINDTDALVPVVNQLRIAQDGAGGNEFNGHIRKLAYYPSRLPDAQLQALTS